jgi:hypothetical protein
MAQLSSNMSVQQETTAHRLQSSVIDQKEQPMTKRDTKNMDYVLRSGLAGGIAGCMVSARALIIDGK